MKIFLFSIFCCKSTTMPLKGQIHRSGIIKTSSINNDDNKKEDAEINNLDIVNGNHLINEYNDKDQNKYKIKNHQLGNNDTNKKSIKENFAQITDNQDFITESEKKILNDNQVNSLIGIDKNSKVSLKQAANLAANQSKNYKINSIRKIPSSNALKILLTKYGVSPIHMINTTNGDTAYHIAIKRKNVSLMNALLFREKNLINSREKNLINVKNFHGLAPIHLVSKINKKEKEKLNVLYHLLSSNLIDVNVQDSEGNTPLHNLINTLFKYESKTCIDKLIDFFTERKNFKYDIKNNNDQTYLHFISMIDTLNNNMAKKLLKKAFKKNIYFVNTKDKFGKTALHYAIENNNTTLGKFLIKNELKYKLNINIQDMQGKTPLHHAIFKQNYEIIDDLLECSDLNINIKTAKDGSTPIHYAVKVAVLTLNLDLLHNILSKYKNNKYNLNLNINTQDNTSDKNTPLHLLILFYEMKKKSLVAQFKDKNKINQHIKDIADLLIENGAKIDLQNNNGDTFIKLANQSDNNYLNNRHKLLK